MWTEVNPVRATTLFEKMEINNSSSNNNVDQTVWTEINSDEMGINRHEVEDSQFEVEIRHADDLNRGTVGLKYIIRTNG